MFCVQTRLDTSLLRVFKSWEGKNRYDERGGEGGYAGGLFDKPSKYSETLTEEKESKEMEEKYNLGRGGEETGGGRDLFAKPTRYTRTETHTEDEELEENSLDHLHVTVLHLLL